MAQRIFLYAAFGALLAGCSTGIDLFGTGVREVDRSRPPANSTEYRCDDNKRFYVRLLDDGAAWVILPERQFRLPKAADGQYANRTTTLQVKGNEASLTDKSDLHYNGCKVPEKS